MNQAMYRQNRRPELALDKRSGDLHRSISRIFDERLFPSVATQDTGWAPSVDIYEQEDAFELKADLPGVAIDAIDITLDKNILTIQGERATADYQEVKTEETGYTRRERNSGAFIRKFSLPETVDGENITASSVDGVLTLRIPKTTAAQPRTIKVSGPNVSAS